MTPRASAKTEPQPPADAANPNLASAAEAAVEAREELARLADLLAQEAAFRDRVERALFEERQRRLDLLRDHERLRARIDVVVSEGAAAGEQRAPVEATAALEPRQGETRLEADPPLGSDDGHAGDLAALLEVLRRQLHRSLESECRVLARVRAVLLEVLFLLASGRLLSPRWFWRCAVLRQSALFDCDWYLQSNPDVAAANADPVLHYLLFGAQEGREPSPVFCGAVYLEANPDVAAAGINPLFHYLCRGRSEGRTAPLS